MKPKVLLFFYSITAKILITHIQFQTHLTYKLELILWYNTNSLFFLFNFQFNYVYLDQLKYLVWTLQSTGQ